MAKRKPPVRSLTSVATSKDRRHVVLQIISERHHEACMQGPLFAPADVEAHLQTCLQLLFAALSKPDSTENEYCMKAVMRIIVFVGPRIVPIAGDCLDWCAYMHACCGEGTSMLAHCCNLSVTHFVAPVLHHKSTECVAICDPNWKMQ